MDNQINIINSKKTFGFFMAILGTLLMLTLWIFRLNYIAVISAGYCCIIALIILLDFCFRKKLNTYYFLAYATASFGITMFYIVFGVDNNFFLRLIYNILLALPSFLILLGVYYLVLYTNKHRIKAKAICLSVCLILTSVIYVFTMNLKSRPNVASLAAGHEEYLNNIDATKTRANNPNVLFILTDDLGYGDISLNGAIYNTPNIDSIGNEGLNFENFYSSYSVCSPSRFAALTGRYPYRGYADNVIYPTKKSYVPFSTTRHFNSFEMGNNVDGMLGDEITIAETLNNAGYATGCFGKWHLGDYGQYLPTNQGFDYFYGSYYANDMTPFSHMSEVNGESKTEVEWRDLVDQSNATKLIHNQINNWVDNVITETDQPFFAYYTTPWPHAPVFAGDNFDGITGMGTYADTVVEFDTYLGYLFQTLEDLGELDNTLIVFTSDNGPALEGSTNNLRGGKYLAYEGGQKVPFLMKYPNSNLITTGTNIKGSATLVDLYPTLVDMCEITGYNGTIPSYMPFDRTIDGISMLPLIDGSKEVIHTIDNPILHMKREEIKSLQYSIPVDEITNEYNYNYDVLNDNEYVTFKYFKNIQNDNSAFFDKYRKNWLHILTDDVGENYNRTSTYPSIAKQMDNRMDEITIDFKKNRRGINKEWYKQNKHKK